MTTLDHAEAMAKRLRAALAAHDHAVPHATALEHVADDGPRFLEAIPILRIFDEAKARAFYCGFLGFEPGLPLYMEVARTGSWLHLCGSTRPT